MEKKIYKFLKYALVLSIIVFLCAVFIPRSYPVPPLQKRATTQYWDLSTGSHIGYTMLPFAGGQNKGVIIYLHGGPGGHISNKDIAALTPLTADGYNVYLYDQIGSGQSGRLKNINEYTVDRHIQDLNEIIQKTGAKQVILIGQSWGAILAALFVAQHPQMVQKIIFTSPGPMYPYHGLANIPSPDSLHLKAPLFTNRMANEKLRNLRTDAIEMFARYFRKRLASDKEVDMFQTRLDYELSKSTVCDTANILQAEAGGGYYAQIMTFNDLRDVPDARDKMRAVAIPVLVMKGQCDNQKWGFTQEYLELFSNHQLAVIPNAGHSISLEEPTLYVNTIKDFLNK